MRLNKPNLRGQQPIIARHSQDTNIPIDVKLEHDCVGEVVYAVVYVIGGGPVGTVNVILPTFEDETPEGLVYGAAKGEIITIPCDFSEIPPCDSYSLVFKTNESGVVSKAPLIVFNPDGYTLPGDDECGCGPKPCENPIYSILETTGNGDKFLNDQGEYVYINDLQIGAENGLHRLNNKIRLGGEIIDPYTEIWYNNPKSLLNNYARHIRLPDGGFVFYGPFTQYNGQAHGRILKTDENFLPDPNFNTGSGLDGEAYWAIYDPFTDSIYLTGEFTTYNGSPAKGIVRLNMDGTIDENFVHGTGFENNVADGIYIYPNGDLLVATKSTVYNGASIGQLVKLDHTGVLQPFQSNTLGNNEGIYDIGVQSDGKIVVVGAFNTLNGQPRNGIARFNADGSVDTAFNTNTGTAFSGSTYEMELDGDKIVVSGAYTSFNGTTRNRIARLNSDGTLDTSFDPGTGLNGRTWRIFVGDDYYVVATEATSYNGQSIGRVLKVDKSGNLDTVFSSNMDTFNNITLSVSVTETDQIVASGIFTAYGSIAQNRISKIGFDGQLNPDTVDSSFQLFFGEGIVSYGGRYHDRYTNRTLVDKEYVVEYVADYVDGNTGIQEAGPLLSVEDGKIQLGKGSGRRIVDLEEAAYEFQNQKRRDLRISTAFDDPDGIGLDCAFTDNKILTSGDRLINRFDTIYTDNFQSPYASIGSYYNQNQSNLGAYLRLAGLDGQDDTQEIGLKVEGNPVTNEYKILFEDKMHEKGVFYDGDYNGSDDDLWIPSWKYVKQYSQSHGDGKYVRYDINNQPLTSTQRQNVKTNTRTVSTDTPDTITGVKRFRSGASGNETVNSIWDYPDGSGEIFNLKLYNNAEANNVRWYWKQKVTLGQNDVTLDLPVLGFRNGVTVIGADKYPDAVTGIETHYDQSTNPATRYKMSMFVEGDTVNNGSLIVGQPHYQNTAFLDSEEFIFSAGYVFAQKGLRTPNPENPAGDFQGGTVYLGHATPGAPGSPAHKLTIMVNGQVFDIPVQLRS